MNIGVRNHAIAFPLLSTRQEAFRRRPAALRQASLRRRSMTIHDKS